MLHGDSVTNYGTMAVEAGATLTLEGDATLINKSSGLINADGGTVAIELDTDTNVNSGTIEAVNGGEVNFYINIEGGSNHGLIEAGAGGTVHFFDTHGGGGGGGGDQGGNYGTMEAADGGILIFDGGLDNFYLVEAVNGGSVDLSNGAHNHAGGTILATGGGIVTIDSGLSNEATATVEADDSASQVNINGVVDNLGTIQATGAGAQVDLANGNFDNEVGGLIEADTGGTVTSIRRSTAAPTSAPSRPVPAAPSSSTASAATDFSISMTMATLAPSRPSVPAPRSSFPTPTSTAAISAVAAAVNSRR